MAAAAVEGACWCCGFPRGRHPRFCLRYAQLPAAQRAIGGVERLATEQAAAAGGKSVVSRLRLGVIQGEREGKGLDRAVWVRRRRTACLSAPSGKPRFFGLVFPGEGRSEATRNGEVQGLPSSKLAPGSGPALASTWARLVQVRTGARWADQTGDPAWGQSQAGKEGLGLKIGQLKCPA